MKDNKNLNVFTMCSYSPWRYPSNWWSNIKQFFRHFKWAWQRVTKGYCDFDCFALDDYYLKLIPSTLRTLSEDTHGYPEKFNTPNKWQEELIGIAENFEAAATTEEEYFKDDNWIDMAIKNYEEYSNFIDSSMRAGFDGFKENFWHLWD